MNKEDTMTDTTKLIQALNAYTGEQESLASFATVASEELGENWISSIYDSLPDLTPELKERLDHAYHYYGATLSWGEVQEYLAQTEPLDISDISERIPTLEYWLNFFGQAGLDIINQLQEKMRQQSLMEQYDTPTETTQQETQSDSSYEAQALNINEMPQNADLPDYDIVPDLPQNPEIPSQDYYNPNEGYAYDNGEMMENTLPSDENYDQYNNYDYDEDVSSYIDDGSAQAYYGEGGDVHPEFSNQSETYYDSSHSQYAEPLPITEPQHPETKEHFMAMRAFRQLDFVNIVHTWIDARCISLGNIEIYKYKYYGFLIDAMEQAKKDIQEVLSSPTYYPALEEVRQDGLNILKNSLIVLEKDLEVAYANSPSDATSLIADEMDVDEARRLLGMVDTSSRREYLGPAPDGFEMIDDPYDS